MRPIILISCYHVKDNELQGKRVRGVKGQDMEMCTWDYIDAVQHAGGIPLLVPNLDTETELSEPLDAADGILFSGGEDVDPAEYGEAAAVENLLISNKRDAFELRLATRAIKSDIPVLGICRGMQLLNIAAGGTLYQDIYEQSDISLLHNNHGRDRHEVIHRVRLDAASSLYELYCKEELGVNSYHHQAVKELSDMYVPAAYSEDGLLEAFEMPDRSFFVAVQWHPEMMFRRQAEQGAIFEAFINASKAYKAGR